jgi:hypothetical protein
VLTSHLSSHLSSPVPACHRGRRSPLGTLSGAAVAILALGGLAVAPQPAAYAILP